MKILDRLVGGTFLRLFMVFVIAAPMLFILGDATDQLDRYLQRGLTPAEVGLGYVYFFPRFILWSFPVAALLATVFTIYPMTTHREVMAAKAGGVSFYRLITPLLLIGVLFTGVALGLSQLVPRTNLAAAEVLGERETRQSWRNNFVYITDEGESLSARRLTAFDGTMVGVTLQSISRNGSEPTRHLLAERATWVQDEGWVFHSGWVRSIHPDGREEASNFDRYSVESLTEGPLELLDTVRDEDEMTHAELGVLAERIQRSGGDAGRVLTKREQQLAIPVATLVIILFGAPLATSSRRGGTAFGIGVSLATTILYLMMFRVSGAMGYAGTISPLLAAWVPNLIFFCGGLLLLSRVRT
ncbi:MAG: LptF/LptG family permease [Gemmatimonadota bacterium]